MQNAIGKISLTREFSKLNFASVKEFKLTDVVHAALTPIVIQSVIQKSLCLDTLAGLKRCKLHAFCVKHTVSKTANDIKSIIVLS